MGRGVIYVYLRYCFVWMGGFWKNRVRGDRLDSYECNLQKFGASVIDILANSKYASIASKK